MAHPVFRKAKKKRNKHLDRIMDPSARRTFLEVYARRRRGEPRLLQLEPYVKFHNVLHTLGDPAGSLYWEKRALSPNDCPRSAGMPHGVDNAIDVFYFPSAAAGAALEEESSSYSSNNGVTIGNGRAGTPPPPPSSSGASPVAPRSGGRGGLNVAAATSPTPVPSEDEDDDDGDEVRFVYADRIPVSIPAAFGTSAVASPTTTTALVTTSLADAVPGPWRRHLLSPAWQGMPGEPSSTPRTATSPSTARNAVAALETPPHVAACTRPSSPPTAASAQPILRAAFTTSAATARPSTMVSDGSPVMVSRQGRGPQGAVLRREAQEPHQLPESQTLQPVAWPYHDVHSRSQVRSSGVLPTTAVPLAPPATLSSRVPPSNVYADPSLPPQSHRTTFRTSGSPSLHPYAARTGYDATGRRNQPILTPGEQMFDFAMLRPLEEELHRMQDELHVLQQQQAQYPTAYRAPPPVSLTPLQQRAKLGADALVSSPVARYPGRPSVEDMAEEMHMQQMRRLHELRRGFSRRGEGSRSRERYVPR